MKPQKIILAGVLLLGALALVSTWALVAAAAGQPITLAVSPTGTYDHFGVATVSGSVQCASTSTVYVSGNLQESVGRKNSVVGSFAINFSCEPGAPVAWSAPVAPTAGKFGSGSVVLTNGAYTAWFRIANDGSYPGPEYANCGVLVSDPNTTYWLCRNDGTFGPQTIRLTNDK